MRAKGYALAAFAAIALAAGGGQKIWQEATTENVTFTVTDKETKRTNSNTDKYLVFTENAQGTTEVFDIRTGPASSSPTAVTASNGLLYMRANDGVISGRRASSRSDLSRKW